jgi:hypothetical protein
VKISKLALEGSRLLFYFSKIEGLVVALILPLHTKQSLIWNGSSSNFSSILVLFEWKKWSYGLVESMLVACIPLDIWGPEPFAIFLRP